MSHPTSTALAIDAANTNELDPITLRETFESAQEMLRSRRADQALPLLRDVLRHLPDHPDALNLASVAFGQMNMAEEAEHCSRQAIAKKPDDAGFHLNLANRLNDQARHDEALDIYGKALELAPDHLPALKSVMRCLVGCKRWPEALAAMEKLLPYVEDDAELLAECAEVCIGARDNSQALHLYQKALDKDPDRVNWLLQLARLAINLDQIELAMATGERVIDLEDNAEMRSMLASIMHRLSDLEKMAVHLAAIPDGSDQAANAANLLGMMQVSQAKIRDGLANMAKTEILAPDAFPLQATRMMYLNYDPELSQEALRAAHWSVGRNFSAALPLMDQRDLALPHDPERRLRIGCVSPDFRAHSVAYFAYPFLSAFDKDRFDVVAYASVAKEDTISADLKTLATDWRNVFDWSDQKLATCVREDKIDILVDLAGLTRGSRLLAFTARPAPIQMTYIGYPNTTGLKAIDYRITDWIADPEGADENYTETLIRMPRCFLNYAVPNHAPPLEPGPCEHRDYITFGSFNNFAKINDDVLALWADVLQAVPNSRFLFKSTTSGDPVAQTEIRNRLQRRGIDPARILFSAFRESPQGHLALYNDVDIALDTFPYNGTTTTCEALWMGVPVVTLRGDRHAGRVGASLLTTIGFDAGIAESREDYVLTARLLAENQGLLKTARRTLRDTVMRSPLCDREVHARTLEDAFRAVWRIWCEEGADAPRNLRSAAPLPN